MQNAVRAVVLDEGIEDSLVVGGDGADELGPDMAQERLGVPTGGRGEGRVEVDSDSPSSDGTEPRQRQAWAPVQSEGGHLPGVGFGQRVVTTPFEARSPNTKVIGQEVWEAVHLSHGDQPAPA